MTRHSRRQARGTELKKPAESTGSWVYARNLSEEVYMEKHGVTDSKDMDIDDLPEADHPGVRELDMQAHGGMDTGKWVIPTPESEIDSLWDKIFQLVQIGELYMAKASTASSNNDGEYVAIVYTPNYLDEDDVWRVREVLRHACDVTKTIYYKPDLYTDLHIYSHNLDEHNVPRASRYQG